MRARSCTEKESVSLSCEVGKKGNRKMEKAIRLATVSISQDEEPEDDGTCLGGFRRHMQRSLKGELQSLKNLTLSAQQVTKLVICVVWSSRVHS